MSPTQPGPVRTAGRYRQGPASPTISARLARQGEITPSRVSPPAHKAASREIDGYRRRPTFDLAHERLEDGLVVAPRGRDFPLDDGAARALVLVEALVCNPIRHRKHGNERVHGRAGVARVAFEVLLEGHLAQAALDGCRRAVCCGAVRCGVVCRVVWYSRSGETVSTARVQGKNKDGC